MGDNALTKLATLGQSIWLDYIRRDLMASGELKRLIDEDGLRGMTSNPSIFQQAIASSQDYDAEIATMSAAGKTATAIYEAISQGDVQTAADIFRPLYDRTGGKDGYVSLEVSPLLAYDTEGTLAEARRFWKELDRPNVFIKVPATLEGLPVIQKLISEGINVNVTLLFGVPRYREVVEAYIAGLEARHAAGLPLSNIASVASFFISRIDVLLDPQLEKSAAAGGPNGDLAKSLVGQVAIASAKVAYQSYKELFGGERFAKLAAAGANTQRLLWASTSTKNPAYRDVKYVEALIGPDTVDTAPLETIQSFGDHGVAEPHIEEDVADAFAALDRLPELGIDLAASTQQLENEGVDKFIASFHKLMDTLQKAMQE